MITEKTSSFTNIEEPAPRSKWLSLIFAFLAILVGLAIAFSAGEYGSLILLAVPLLIVFVFALSQPQLGLVAFIVITFTQFSEVGIKFHGYGSIAQPLAGFLLVLIVLRIALYGERPEGFGRALPILVIYALVWFASLLHAGNYLAALNAFIGFAKDALGAVIVIFFIQRPSSLKQAVWAIIFAGLFMTAISIFQEFSGTFSNNYWGFGGWQHQTTGDSTRHRLTGPYANPNAYAQVLVMIVPLAIDRLWHERRMILRILAGVTAALCTLTIAFTYSRGGFLTLIFVTAMLITLRRPNLMPMLLTGALLIGVVQFIPASYNTRILTLLQFVDQGTQVSDPSFRGRTSENIAAWQMFMDNPLLGVGLGNFPENYQNYSRSIGLDQRRVPRSPASLYLELLSEQGLIGTGIFLFLMVLIFRELRYAKRNFNLARMTDEGNIVLALSAGFAGYLFAAITKNSAYSNVFWVIVGVALASGQVAHASRMKAEEIIVDQPEYGS
ncbi:MAG TPA: O-antigen ligase family protein [Anaerolineales bacterium]|jgi:O-antigen ligase